MKVDNIKIYDMSESIVASGLPMQGKPYDADEFKQLDKEVALYLYDLTYSDLSDEEMAIKISEDASLPEAYAAKAVKRICKLGATPPGSGHNCACKGIIVNANITANQSFWLQWERYHFQDTISSMSTMHRITKMNLDELCSGLVDQRVKDVLEELIEVYNQCPSADGFARIIDNIPQGIMLTRRITTNYLQLKTMLDQRKNHKMESWNTDFVNFCGGLPLFKLFFKLY